MNTTSKTKTLIFTDLDGSLLDLENYSHQAASEALRRILERRIPLVFCSSKTRLEQEFYQNQTGIRAPFIVENGSAIFIPQGYFAFEFEHQRSNSQYKVIELGIGVEGVRQPMKEIRKELGLQFRGYAEMSLDELCAITGLPESAALRAKQRDYSETISGLNDAKELESFRKALSSYGLACQRGSRFYTIASATANKGKAVSLLSELFNKMYGAITTIGIGDGFNDASMLAAVDKAFLLQKPDGVWEAVVAPRLTKFAGIGASGWNEIVCSFLD